MSSSFRILVTFGVVSLAAPMAWAEDRALIVSVGEYRNQWPFRDLKGGARNVALMREVAGHLGFSDDQILVIEDEKATYSGIKGAFRNWLTDGVLPGERALFYFSGHGYYGADGDGDEPDGKDEILIPHDYGGDWSEASDGTSPVTLENVENVLVDDELAAWLDDFRTDDVLVFLDSCHSATAMRSFGRGGYPFFEGDASRVVGSGGGLGTGYLSLSAAGDEEQALGTAQGAFFTVGVHSAVSKAVENGDPVTMNAIHKAASDEIERLLANAREKGEDRFEIHRPVLTGDLRRANENLLRSRRDVHRWRALITAADVSRSVDVTGLRHAYRQGDRMALEIEMPVDGYLHVLTIVDGADAATSLFPAPLSRRDAWFEQHEYVRIPDSSRGDRFTIRARLETSGDEERNLLMVIVNDRPLDLRRPSHADLSWTLRRADAAAAVEYLVRRR